jgi:hypothetical protein
VTELKSDWPGEPYKGLAHYGPSDRPLFTGRDEDVDFCIHFLAAPETRILLLHGQTGCGKSSFLRAGLIPCLEERAFGYFFLRDAAGMPLFIRCGPDPIGRIAEHLFPFASQPVHVDSVKGDHAYDVSAACLEQKNLKDYVEACRKPGELMRSLQALSKALPYTLVIILDQAEEVITLAEGHSDYRRQFFRFVREFSTTNFPLKFVLALRKDNSGEFIGLAQIGGSLELPALPADAGIPGPGAGVAVSDRPSGGSEATDRPVKSDIKIFLLSELTRDEVLQAIVLPTSTEEVDQRSPPFDTYQFDYTPGVAQAIVRDIFEATSSTAVLPVMQIVCRDLYNRVTDENYGTALPPKRTRSKPWHIDSKLYLDGGGISGPVDRHVSRSLVASFRGMVAEGNYKDEERRWREILFRLVRRESDGTVHTNIVSLAQLRAIADEMQPIARLDEVVEYLTQPDILLLRSVTILSADDPDEGRWFSLGHDFIGMVLQRWKLREEEADAAHRRVARFAKTAGWATLATAAVLGTLIYVGYREREQGIAMSKHGVLLKTATFMQREEPMLAMLAAVHGTRVATDLSKYRLGFGKKARDTRADQLLANMIAGTPRMTEFSSETSTAAPPGLGSNDGSVALPKSKGFVNIGATRAEIITDAASESRGPPLELDEIPAPGPGNFPAQTSIAIGEPKPGTLLVMRTVSTSPLRDLDSSSHQLLAFIDGKAFGSFDADYFRNFGGDVARKPTVASDEKQHGGANAFDDFARFSREGITSLELSGGIVVLYTFRPPGPSSKGSLTVDSFVFDERKTPNPFRRGMVNAVFDWESYNALGLTSPLFVDGYLLLPENASDDDGSVQTRLLRYDLRRSKRGDSQGIDIKDLPQSMKCPAEQGCQWQLIPRRGPGPLLTFGALKSSDQRGRRSIEQLVQADIDNFERFAVADVSSGRALPISAAELRADRSKCTGRPDPASASASASKAPTTLFMSGTVDALVIGFPAAHAVDVVRVAGASSGSAHVCVGTLMVPAEISQYSVSADGTTLLGVGPRSGAVWSLKETVAERAGKLLASGNLTELACAAGLKDYKPDKDKWMAATYLEPEPDVCNVMASGAADSSVATTNGAR